MAHGTFIATANELHGMFPPLLLPPLLSSLLPPSHTQKKRDFLYRPHAQNWSRRLAQRMVDAGYEKQTGTEGKTTPASREWACGHSKVPQQSHDWATVVNPGKYHHGGPAAATCTLGTKASPHTEHHPPRRGSGPIQERRERHKDLKPAVPVRATSMLGNTAKSCADCHPQAYNRTRRNKRGRHRKTTDSTRDRESPQDPSPARPKPSETEMRFVNRVVSVAER